MKARRLPVLVAAALAITTASAFAYWATGSAAGSIGSASAASVNQGSTPSAGLTAAGREVSVNWGASTLSNGVSAGGYLVKRYPAGGGVATISPIGTCTGTVTGITCLEDDTPPGSWQYTITPTIGNWQGSESLLSGVVTVSGANLGINGSPFGDAAFTPAIATTTGTVSGFSGTGSAGHGEGLTYRLDGATTLSGSPAFVGTDGNAAITSLGIPKSAGDGPHTLYALGDAAYVPSQASAGIVIDTTAPNVSAQLSPLPGAGGWNNTSPVDIALVADDGTGSGVSGIKYTTDGSDPKTSGTAQVYTGSTFAISGEGTTTVEYFATDVAGNASAVQTQLVKIDTAPPTNSLSLSNVSGGLYPTTGPLAGGTTVYYRGTAGGSFTIRNGVADALSGPASSATSSLAGTSTGWSHTPSLVTTPAGGPYVSSTLSWSPGTSSSPSESVTGRDVADNFASTTVSFTNDSISPAGGSVDATGLVGTGTRYSSSTTLSISFAKGSDLGSGLAAAGAKLLRASASLNSSNGLSNGTCGTFGAFTQVGSDDPASPFTDNAAGGITTGYCYQYEYDAPDNVGNTATYFSPAVKVDTSGPSAPSPSLSSATGNTYISGTTAYINAQAGKSGSFQASASPTDNDSGILKVNFPTLTGFSSGGGDSNSSPFQTTYNWSGAVGASGTQTTTAYNNANLTNTATFTVTPDTTNPSSGALTVNSTAATTGGTNSYNNDGSYTIAAITDYSDAGSGLASSLLTRQSATLTSSNGIAAGSCGSYGSATTIPGRVVPITQTLTGPTCYLYTLTGTDNVGNTVSITTTVKVDTSGPSAPSPSLSSATGNTYISGTTAYINAQAGKSGSFQASASPTDNDSGILKVNFPTLTGFSSGGGDSNSSPFQTTYNWSGAVGASGTQTTTAYNNANLTNTATFTVTPDTTNPSSGALTVNSTAATTGGTNSYNNDGSYTIAAITDYSDAGSGLASSLLTRQSATLTSSNGIAAGSCGSYGSATTIPGRVVPITQTLTGPTCYLYTLTGTDNVGNTVSITTTVKVDTSGPSAPSPSLSSATGNTYISGTTAYINAQAGKSGSFQASASPTDNDSGILKVNFPTLTGFSSGGGDSNSSPFQTTYNWSGAVGASGTQTTTAYNNANLTNTATFTVTPDTTNPSSGALTVNSTAATTGGTNSSTTNPNFTINARTNYSEATGAQSGLATSTLTIQSETLTSNTTCGAAGSGGPYLTPTTIAATTNPAITVGYCYLYKLTGTDNVGNAVSITTTVKVPFAGIDWTNITTSNNRPVTCVYTTITVVTCSVSGVGNGGTFNAKVTLIDANQASVSNTTGASIGVSQATTGQGSSSPAPVTIAQNVSVSSTAFTLTLSPGGSRTATITASISVNGVTYTVNCQVSS